jgi:hypothetical protein
MLMHVLARPKRPGRRHSAARGWFMGENEETRGVHKPMAEAQNAS